jgi:hypothetical protein
VSGRRPSRLADGVLHLALLGTQLEVGVGGLVGSRGDLWRVLGGGLAFVEPLLAAAVHQLEVLVTVHLEHPEGVGGEPVVVVAVEDDRVAVADAGFAEELFDIGLAEDVATGLILQLAGPVEADGARDVAFVVGVGVDVDLDELNAGVGAVLGDPVGGDEYVLSWHGSMLLSKQNCLISARECCCGVPSLPPVLLN